MSDPNSAAEQISDANPIVFFDGVCGLCNAIVDWIMARDPIGRFRFAPLQGSTAAQVLSEHERADLNTIVILKKRRLFRRSDAVVEILLDLGRPWRTLGFALRFTPRFVRDLGYRAVAKSRYRIFGKLDACRLPTAEERKRFLD